MAAINKLVAIGRLMKVSEMFTLALCLKAWSLQALPLISPLHRDLRGSALVADRKTRTLRTATDAPPSAAAAGRGTAGAVAGLDARALLEAELTFHDNRFAGFEPLVDDDVVAHPLCDGDGPLIHRRIRLDHEDELTVLSGLDGLARHHRRVRQRCEPQVHARE